MSEPRPLYDASDSELPDRARHGQAILDLEKAGYTVITGATPDARIMSALNTAAGEIARGFPANKWVSWATELLQALDSMADDELTRPMLEAVQRDIQLRLDDGEW